MNGARNFGMLAAAAALFAVAGCATNDVGPCGDTAATYVVIDLSAGSNAEKYDVSYLNEVPEGVYLLNAAPINLGQADGAPCRAVLIKE